MHFAPLFLGGRLFTVNLRMCRSPWPTLGSLRAGASLNPSSRHSALDSGQSIRNKSSHFYRWGRWRARVPQTPHSDRTAWPQFSGSYGTNRRRNRPWSQAIHSHCGGRRLLTELGISCAATMLHFAGHRSCCPHIVESRWSLCCRVIETEMPVSFLSTCNLMIWEAFGIVHLGARGDPAGTPQRVQSLVLLIHHVRHGRKGQRVLHGQRGRGVVIDISQQRGDRETGQVVSATPGQREGEGVVAVVVRIVGIVAPDDHELSLALRVPWQKQGRLEALAGRFSEGPCWPPGRRLRTAAAAAACCRTLPAISTLASQRPRPSDCIPSCWQQLGAAAAIPSAPYARESFTHRQFRTRCAGGGRLDSHPPLCGGKWRRFLRTPGFNWAWKLCWVCWRRAPALLRERGAGGAKTTTTPRSKERPQRSQTERREAVVAGGSVTSAAVLVETATSHGPAGGEGGLQRAQQPVQLLAEVGGEARRDGDGVQHMAVMPHAPASQTTTTCSAWEPEGGESYKQKFGKGLSVKLCVVNRHMCAGAWVYLRFFCISYSLSG